MTDVCGFCGDAGAIKVNEGPHKLNNVVFVKIWWVWTVAILPPMDCRMAIHATTFTWT